ncbi:polysaccharide biosynthesis C-terminal domain-containing protein [Bradyrhizobium xenonodulans]|uniref:Polysaccharide biosynthesis C-terminal domain-containing protein n=1 Tax=Bradyrhizobium xenonodulans TaxID=2736875 RepID=A0ABY7MSD1_9BRAD|nr:polysaccharide biosynthesis C-terminal domain-containing protein [Bradyrhizobium xenonodulans]WBL80337.1 polysaccharide biosynthesis C-terminal domain-containing protein [Bradyrhizobium xenonodulans]
MIRNAFIKRAIGALTLLYSGTFLAALFNFIAQLTLARSMDLEALGTIAALSSVINLLALIGMGGMNWFLLQVVGREKEEAFRWYFPAAQLVALLTGLGMVALVAYTLTIAKFPPSERLLLLVASVPILLGQLAVELSSLRYQIERSAGQVAFWQVVTQLGRAVVALCLTAFAILNLRAVLVGFGLMGAIAIVWSLFAIPARSWDRLLKSYRHPRPSVLETASSAGPFLLFGAIYLVFFQGPIVILEYVRGGTETAQYNVALLIVSAAMMFPSVFYSKFIAERVFHWGHHDRTKFAAAFYLSAALMATVGVFTMAILVAAASWLIPWLFGSRYVASVDLLLVMSIGIPTRFLQSAYSSLLVTGPQTRPRVVYLGLAALTSIVASCIFVPALGALGAAYATVLAELVLFLLSWRGLSIYVPEIRPLGWLSPKTIRKSLSVLGSNAAH